MQSLTFEELLDLAFGTALYIDIPKTSRIEQDSIFADAVRENLNFKISGGRKGKVYIRAGKLSKEYSIRRAEIEEGDIVVFIYEDKSQEVSKNNDGLLTCHYCGAPTKEVDTGMFSKYRVCTNRECEEWKC